MDEILILRSRDIDNLQIPIHEVLELAEQSLRGIIEGNAVNPPKIAIAPIQKSLAIAMLAHCPSVAALGIKSYTEFPLAVGRSRTSSTLALYDDASGHLLALMDCRWITATRTGAVTALFARDAARPNARLALIVGAGAQARETIPPLLRVLPNLEEIVICAPRREAVAALIAAWAHILDGRPVRFCDNLRGDAMGADIIVGAGGPGAQDLVHRGMLKQGATAILVGYGLAADMLHGADRVLATSEAQMWVTGRDLVSEQGQLPAVDAELPDILARRKAARTSDSEIVFAYNSGLAVTDVAVAKTLYRAAREAGAGELIAGF